MLIDKPPFSLKLEGNTSSPMTSTDSGMSIAINEIFPANAASPIVVR